MNPLVKRVTCALIVCALVYQFLSSVQVHHHLDDNPASKNAFVQPSRAAATIRRENIKNQNDINKQVSPRNDMIERLKSQKHEEQQTITRTPTSTVSATQTRKNTDATEVEGERPAKEGKRTPNPELFKNQRLPALSVDEAKSGNGPIQKSMNTINIASNKSGDGQLKTNATRSEGILISNDNVTVTSTITMETRVARATDATIGVEKWNQTLDAGWIDNQSIPAPVLAGEAAIRNGTNNISNNESVVSNKSYSIVPETNVMTPMIARDETMFPAPNESNTVISMISMGNAAKDTYYVERIIRSIRKRGRFTGTIMVYTDAEGSSRYNRTLVPWDSNVIVVIGKPQDMNPIHSVKWAKKRMIFKRFKTLMLDDYLQDYPQIATTTRYVLYVDIDIVCTNPLDQFFEDYHQFLNLHYSRRVQELHYANFSFISAYLDPHVKPLVHGGFLMHDRLHSGGCLNLWRKMFDTIPAIVDQIILKYTLEDPSCEVLGLDDMNGRHYDIASGANLRISNISDMATFVHITNSVQSKKISTRIQEAFVRKALALESNETVMVGNITWDEVVRVKRFEKGVKKKGT